MWPTAVADGAPIARGWRAISSVRDAGKTGTSSAQKRQDAIDAAAIDEFAAQPERVHEASNLECGISPWNSRRAPEPTAAYWSPLPDPDPSEQGWRWSLMNGKLHHRY